MKKKMRALMILLVLTLYVLLMTACSEGSKINTTLSVNQDLSGTRVMEVVVSDSLGEDEFLATIEELKSLIEQICPSELTWEYAQESELDVFTFKLSFSGKEDYEKKISSLLGEETTVTLEVPDSVWANGIEVSETFSSEQLLEWLSLGLVEAEYVAEENASKIFSLSNSFVEYQGAEYSSYNHNINTNQVKYLYLERIVMDTKVLTKGVYERTIQFEIPTNSMEENGEKITTYLESLVPSAATSTWGEYDYGTTFEIVGGQLTDETIQIFTASVLDTEVGGFQRTQEESHIYFDFVDIVEEEIDLTSFNINSNGVRVTCTLTSEGSVVAKSQNSWDSTSAEYPTIVIVDGYIRESIIATYSFTQSYQVRAVEIQASSISEEGAHLETTITVEGIPTEDEQVTIVERFQERAMYKDVSGDGETHCLYEVTTDTETNNYKVILEQEYLSESEDEVRVAESDIDNLPIYVEVHYEEDSSLTELKTPNKMELSASLGNLASSYSEDFLFTYALNAGLLNKIEKIDVNGYGDFITVSQYNSNYKVNETERAVHDISRNKYVFMSNQPSVHMNVALECSETDIITVLLYIVIAIGAFVFFKIHSKKKAAIPQGIEQTGGQPLVTEQPVQQPQPVMNETVEASPKGTIFCESCGAKMEEGTKFCESCGNKVE